MSLNSFVNNLVNEDFDLSDTQVFRLKDCVSELNTILKDIYSPSKHLKSEKRFKSMVATNLLQTKKFDVPDDFYSFNDDNVNISIINFRKNYWIKITGYNVSTKTLQTMLDSEYYSHLNLFSSDNTAFTQITSLDKTDSQFLGSYPKEKFSHIIHVWHVIINMYLTDKGVN